MLDGGRAAEIAGAISAGAATMTSEMSIASGKTSAMFERGKREFCWCSASCEWARLIVGDEDRAKVISIVLAMEVIICMEWQKYHNCTLWSLCRIVSLCCTILKEGIIVMPDKYSLGHKCLLWQIILNEPDNVEIGYFSVASFWVKWPKYHNCVSEAFAGYFSCVPLSQISQLNFIPLIPRPLIRRR